MTDAEILARRFEAEARGDDQELLVEVARVLWDRVPAADRRRLRDQRLREAASALHCSAWQKALRLHDLLGRALVGRPLPRVPEATGILAAVTALPRSLTPRAIFTILKKRPRNFQTAGALHGGKEIHIHGLNL